MEPVATPDLMSQGLILTVVGMGLVFAGLGLLWALLSLLARAFPERPSAAKVTALSVSPSEAFADPALTAERAHVAAVVAGALMSNAMWLRLEPPVGPAFEHGRTAPLWVTANRARSLQTWQPARRAEDSGRESVD